MRALGVALLALCAGCSIYSPVPQARVRLGPASDARLDKILALPTRCQAEGPDLCTDVQALAVDATTRMSLEFAGMRLVDSEIVNAYLRRRVTVDHGGASQSEVDSEGATWATSTPADRSRLLEEMGIDGYLTTQITVGPRQNVEDQRTITVTVSIIRAADLAPAWSSRCSIETGRFYFADEAVEVAARCALESALRVGT